VNELLAGIESGAVSDHEPLDSYRAALACALANQNDLLGRLQSLGDPFSAAPQHRRRRDELRSALSQP
jgi:hypothetical protein